MYGIRPRKLTLIDGGDAVLACTAIELVLTAFRATEMERGSSPLDQTLFLPTCSHQHHTCLSNSGAAVLARAISTLPKSGPSAKWQVLKTSLK